MLQPRIRPICLQCRFLLSSSTRTYATAVEDRVHASTSTADTTSFTPSAAPQRRDGGGLVMKTYKPRTPGLRHLRRPINDHLWKGGPHRPLTFPKIGHGKGGRNNSGRITVRHRGGGARRRIRTVDFERNDPGKHIVERIEYDPNRSAHLALLENLKNKKKSYIIAAEGMRAGDTVESFRAGIPSELIKSMGGVVDPGMLAARTAFRGNCLPMYMMPLGVQIYCVGSQPKKGAVFCRSAGTYATVMSKEEKKGKVESVTVRMQSGEIRKVSKDACGTVGVASNPHWQFRQLGKAGRSRWLNIRPTVRGVAMNAADHPHGGGRGKSKGNVHPVSIWGTPVSLIRPFTNVQNELIIFDRPKVDTRRGRKAISTNTSSLLVQGIRASDARRNKMFSSPLALRGQRHHLHSV
jgi:ribosomal protein L2